MIKEVLVGLPEPETEAEHSCTSLRSCQPDDKCDMETVVYKVEVTSRLTGNMWGQRNAFYSPL